MRRAAAAAVVVAEERWSVALGRGTLDPDTASWSMHVAFPASSSSSSLYERRREEGREGERERHSRTLIKWNQAGRRVLFRRLLRRGNPYLEEDYLVETIGRGGASVLCNVGASATFRDLPRPLPDGERARSVGGSPARDRTNDR